MPLSSLTPAEQQQQKIRLASVVRQCHARWTSRTHSGAQILAQLAEKIAACEHEHQQRDGQVEDNGKCDFEERLLENYEELQQLCVKLNECINSKVIL